MIGLIKTVIIFVVVYYALKFITKLAFPYVMKSVVKKAQKNMEDQFNQHQQFTEERPEGEVTIDKGSVKKPKKGSVSGASDDDYVDFEEVD